jgi:hypothetical protein
VCAGLLLGAGVLTKNEGSLLAGIALVVSALASLGLWRRGHERRPLGRVLLPVCLALAGTALAVALLLFWRSQIPNRFDEGYSLPPPPALIRAVIDRVPQLPEPMWKKMSDEKAWGGFWYLVPLVLLAGAPAWRRRPLRSLAMAVGGGLSLYLVAYSITPWQGTEMVPPTWNRFLIQQGLPGLVGFSMCVRALFPGATH